MKRQRLLIGMIAVLTAALVILVCITLMTRQTDDPKGSDSTQPPKTNPSTAQTQPSETDSTQTNPTQTDPQPTETEPTEPEPTDPDAGTIYTRAELEAMDTTEYGYGPGKATNGNRAPYAVSEQAKYAQYAANFIAPDDGNIYLTFDCGYEYTATDDNGNKYRVTEKILDILKEKDVKAVFFVTMFYCKDQPDLVQRMIDEGHVVGNHSNNHPVMPQQTIDKMIYEVTSLHDYVLENFGYKMTLFRPPTGAFSVQSLAVVQSLGYKNVHWSFAHADWDTANQPDVDKALANVTGSAHSGAIYLLHAVSTTNASLLGDAIDYFRANGYTLALFQ